SLETLSLILLLITNNPKQVFYARGNHEHENHFDFGIKNELRFKARSVSNEKIPLKKEILDFFETLPLAIYAMLPNTKQPEYIKISGQSPRVLPASNQAFFADFLAKKSDFTFETFKLPKAKGLPSKQKIKLKANIIAESRSKIYRQSDGLILIPQEQQATTWTTLSSQTQTYQNFYDFYYDAFVCLEAHEIPHNWRLSLYYRDIRKKDGFKIRKFNPFAGTEIIGRDTFPKEPPPQPFVVGCTLDLSGEDKTVGKRLKNGIELRINEENQRGGINGRLLKVIFLDDQYTPHIAKRNVQTFIEKYNIDILLVPSGSANLRSYLHLVREGKILVLFPFTGSTSFRDPTLEYIVHYRPLYDTEDKVLTLFALKNLQKRKFCIFREESEPGIISTEAFQEAFKKHNVSKWLDIPYSVQKFNYKLAAKKIVDFAPEVIFFGTTAAAAINMIKEIGLANLLDTLLMADSGTPDSLRDFLNNMGLKTTLSRIVPDPANLDKPITKEYHAAQEKRRETFLKSYDSLEGYIGASLFIQALHNIKEPFTKEKIASYFTKLKDYNFKGIPLSFNPETRQLNKRFWLDFGDQNIVPVEQEENSPIPPVEES
ncbi:ABC transporter substrate-binding protein, partial [Candidatus Babeliales bacterium]|nr:ABC transporter substrate-binding protein [Candidatus Babeliales bacterium]